ncbi:MAG TPA: cupredoxin domain-containing protein [Thermomicrobiales bacterium]|nr:cupredoxin domain-containing protein [Thermomicrobiales bacterium]
MSARHFSLGRDEASLKSAARRSTVSLEAPRHSRLGRWANALAVLSLVLLMGVGFWFSGYGTNGSGDNHPVRYAAQVVTPLASPETQATACTIEPLTAEEVMDRISDPDGWVAEYLGERLPFTPGQLVDPSQLIRDTAANLDEPEQEEFEAMKQATNQYLDCLREGTVGQFWATFSPHMLQQEIFGKFPIYRSEEAVRSYVEESLGLAAAGFSFPPYAWDDITLEAVPDRAESRVNRVLEPFVFAYVPSQGVGPDGTVIARSDWKDRIENLVETSGPAPSLGAITLVQYPGADQWFINDTWVQASDMVPVESPAGDSTDIVIAAEDIQYDVTELTVPAKTDVKITVVNNGFIQHDFVIDELGVSIGPLGSGERAEVVINAEPGEYTYYCSVPGHRDAGMEGKIIVK